MSLERFKKRKEPPKPFLRAEDANALFAEQVADALGLSLKVQGRHVELENGIRGSYRGPRLVWCHKDGTGIGDNCALAQVIAGVEFRPALELLLGYAQAHPVDYAPAPAARKVLRVPGTSAEDQQLGREYLRSRGISDAALAAAEASKMLQYTAGAVLFVGYDGQQRKSATRRGYAADDPNPKRDLAGSDKSWPAILPGALEEVWVVEGGTDALALHTMHPGRPTVIVSGGSRVQSWIPQPHVQALLKRAGMVVIACENERTPEIQSVTDAEHQAQARLIVGSCSDVRFWRPPEGTKDLADLAIQLIPPTQLQSLLQPL